MAKPALGRCEPCYQPQVRRLARWILPPLYAGRKVGCPCCDGRFRRFIPRYRGDLLCPRCLSLQRHRAFWLFLEERLSHVEGHVDILHIAPEEGIASRLRTRASTRYVNADADPHSIADLTFDITAIPFDDRSFDIVLCSHVLEHVPDDREAMRELFRVLRPASFFYSLHPVSRSQERTIEDITVTDPAERARLFGQHDHFRRYGIDFVDRLREAGFEVAEERYAPSAETVAFYGLRPEQPIFVCRRPAG